VIEGVQRVTAERVHLRYTVILPTLIPALWTTEPMKITSRAQQGVLSESNVEAAGTAFGVVILQVQGVLVLHVGG